jgi:hypothetical protein
MGGGSFTTASYNATLSARGRTHHDYMASTTTRQVFESVKLHELLNPKGVIRECCDSDEHPATIPVILGYDVTGSMGSAAMKVAKAINPIMQTLYKSTKDIEFLISAIGDMECDNAPFQASQFESDGRIVDASLNVYFEGGGGGNSYESYTAPWYFGVNQCKLDCHKRQQKGVIITMGDEPLNPFLPKGGLITFLGQKAQADSKTDVLYKQASELFDIYHIGVDDDDTSYSRYESRIKETFGKLLKQNFIVSSIDRLPEVIVKIIENRATEFKLPESEETGTIEIGPNGIRW